MFSSVVEPQVMFRNLVVYGSDIILKALVVIIIANWLFYQTTRLLYLCDYPSHANLKNAVLVKYLMGCW